MPQNIKPRYLKCGHDFSSSSGLSRHQTYSSKCMVNYTYHDIIYNSPQTSRKLQYNFYEGSGSSLMTAVAFTEPDDVMINMECSQNNCDVVPPNEMDDHGRHIYMMPSCNNAEILELKENKYYLWINKHEF